MFKGFGVNSTRREMLVKSGKIGIAAVLPLSLAACLDVTDNAFLTAPDGGIAIQISEGQNCWKSQCFTYSSRNGTVSVVGREPIALPAGIDVTDGYISEDEFNELLAAARNADRTQIGGSSSGSGGTGGSGCGDCGSGN